jgi:phosphate starvation-inducible PhoH-like protein
MEKNPIVFSTGVAGTGKTYLAVAYAVSQLKNEKIKKIILTRPAVEAGESLGFLPGDMKEKVDPYLRPLYDALNEILGAETVERLLEKEIIEIAPLAFMRGRTLNDAVVILDEAQNTTQAQMKMFLTRMGQNSQIIVTGDITQIDLIKKKDSGLIQACQILQGIDGIEMVHLSELDVVRHPLVQKIIDAYSKVE